MLQPNHPASPKAVSNALLPPELRAEFEHLERVLGGGAALQGASVSHAVARAPHVTDAAGAPDAAGVGALAVVAYPLEPNAKADQGVAYRATEQFPSASTIKVYVLQALLEMVAAGDADLDDELLVGAEDQVSGSGVLTALTPGRRYTLRDLATLMIVVSDNTATNVLIEFVGLDEVNASIQAHGWTGTRSAGKLQTAAVLSGAKRSSSVTTAADLADHMARLWRGELLPPPLTEEAKAIYRKQQFSELGRSIGYDSYLASIGEAPWRIASKSGSITGVRNDVGVFEPLPSAGGGGEPFVVAIMTKGCIDPRFHAENLGAKVVGLAAAAVFARLG
ncbi:MAG TPA: serine hydrolase [Trueperaceae bacterium]|nr:serine hydrolase [Trueperaceae bacterium]